jgi:hypothetical protein
MILKVDVRGSSLVYDPIVRSSKHDNKPSDNSKTGQAYRILTIWVTRFLKEDSAPWIQLMSYLS